MMNPDGVVIGNYRNSLAGEDLNRKFLSRDLALFPEVKALQELITRSSLLTGFIDLHGHSQRKWVFAYGPEKHPEAKTFLVLM
jgi:murein tripeptide amidase MpaA